MTEGVNTRSFGAPVWTLRYVPFYRNTEIAENMITCTLVLMGFRFLCFVLFRAVLITCPGRQDFWAFMRSKVILAIGLVDRYGLGIDWLINFAVTAKARHITQMIILINFTRPFISIQLIYKLYFVDARTRFLDDTFLRLFTDVSKSWAIFGVVQLILRLIHWARYVAASSYFKSCDTCELQDFHVYLQTSHCVFVCILCLCRNQLFGNPFGTLCCTGYLWLQTFQSWWYSNPSVKFRLFVLKFPCPVIHVYILFI